MPTSSTSTAGFITSLGIRLTAAAPANENTKAQPAAGRISAHGRRTRRMKLRAALAVPKMDENLLVPNRVAVLTSGSALNNAGIWISPPPPTAESISPATNAMAPKNNNSSITMSPRHAGRRSAQERETSGLSTRTSKHLSFNRPGIRRPSPALAASR